MAIVDSAVNWAQAMAAAARGRSGACESDPMRTWTLINWSHVDTFTVALSVSCFFLAPLWIGCQGETQAVDAGADAPRDAEIDAMAAFDGGLSEAESGGSTEAGGGSGDAHSCSDYTLCILMDGSYECDCDPGTRPACPSSAGQGAPCDYPGPPSYGCFGCRPGFGSFGCACLDAGESDASGSHWFCLTSPATYINGQLCQ